MVLAIMLARDTLKLESATFTAAELYWHFVNVTWIVMVPLFYFIGRT
ncbi:MAG: hypothetical protein P8Y71_08555 [Pseudolabrys sp.]